MAFQSWFSPLGLRLPFRLSSEHFPNAKCCKTPFYGIPISQSVFPLSIDRLSSTVIVRMSTGKDHVLWARNLTKTHDGRVYQFRDESFSLSRGDKVAILGPNGTGKSTLLEILAGVSKPDSGQVSVRKGAVVALVSQSLPSNLSEDLTVSSVVLQLASTYASTSAVKAMLRLSLAVKEANITAGDSSNHSEALARLASVTADMEKHPGAWQVDSLLTMTLTRLGLNGEMRFGNLSGGQKRRVGIAAALVSKPDVMLLDEVTNHLSIEGIQFLEEVLSDPSLTVAVISHDRVFVDRVCTTAIWELDNTLHRYPPGYDAFLSEKAERLAADESRFDAMRRAMRKELEWLRRQPKARGTKSKARIDDAHKLQQAIHDHSYRNDGRTSLMRAVKPSGARLGSDVVTVDSVTLRRGERLVLHDFSYTFERNERLGLVGGNGVGKSSLLRALSGEIPLERGSIHVGDTVVFGHFDQDGIDLSAPLSEGSAAVHGVSSVEGLRVIDYVSELSSLYSSDSNANSSRSGTLSGGSSNRNGDDVEARVAHELDILKYNVPLPPHRNANNVKGNLLSRMSPIALLDHFGFPREKQHDFVRHLSGGERRRLQLMGLLLKNPNFLMLDEISNDLDVNTLTMVEEILIDHTGVLILCSHDRFMLDRLVDHFLVLEGNGEVSLVEGKYSNYLEKKKAAEEKAKRKRKNEGSSSKGSRYVHSESGKRKMSFKERKEYERLEEEIEQCQEEYDKLSERLATDGEKAGYERVKIWSEQMAQLEKLVDEKTDRWIHLAELLN